MRRSDPVRATFGCAVCPGLSVVVLLPPGAADPRLRPDGDHRLGADLIGLDSWRLSIDGPMRITISPVVEHEAVADALRKGDAVALASIDPEYASFWCPRCRACYWRDLLPGVMEFDQGFYDATYAVCPAGHRVMLDD